MPFIAKDEKNRIKDEINGKHISLCFDGTSRLGEALAIVICYISDDWTIQHCLIHMKMLAKSLKGEELAREVLAVLSTIYGIPSDLLLATMRDCSSVNNTAIKTISIIYPVSVDVGCFAHTLNHVGEKFVSPTLTDFVHNWINLFSHSPKAKLQWRTRVGQSMSNYSTTRWWSKWEVIKMVLLKFGDIHPFLLENEDIGPATRSKLLAFFSDQQKLALLKLEMATLVDWGQPFVSATYYLEGEGPLALDCYETIEKVAASIHTAHTPNVNAIARQLTGSTQSSDQVYSQLLTYSRNCV